MSIENIRRIKAEAASHKIQKIRKPIPKKSKKRLKEEAEDRVKAKAAGGSEMERWFQERRKSMTGFCANCGKPSCKDSDEYFRFSLAHILPKAYVKSVATNDNNWVELCFWGENSCHTQMDHHMLDMTEMSCWNEIVEKFQKMYPFIAEKEKRRIPDTLRQYIEIDK